MDQNLAVVVVELHSGWPIVVRDISTQRRLYCNTDKDIMQVAEERAVEYIKTFCSEIDS